MAEAAIGGGDGVDRPARRVWPSDTLILVDVGGAGGLQREWQPYAGRIFPVLVEPSPSDAQLLRETLARNGQDALVLEMGLADAVGPQTLHVARNPGCSSLRQPDVALLSRYRIGKLFETRTTLTVECTRYDVLHAENLVPQPDALKIDVQGFEYEVLQGFGDLLAGCLGVELETHVYPVYRGQKLMHDLIAYLATFGFVLRRVAPKANFDGDVVELDVWFTKDIGAWRAMTPLQRNKFDLISEVWCLREYGLIDPDMPHLHGITRMRPMRAGAKSRRDGRRGARKNRAGDELA